MEKLSRDFLTYFQDEKLTEGKPMVRNSREGESIPGEGSYECGRS
jgi:hypothetical protein